jgi:hypothetical protein
LIRAVNADWLDLSYGLDMERVLKAPGVRMRSLRHVYQQ